MEQNNGFRVSIRNSTKDLDAKTRVRLMYSPSDIKLNELEEGTKLDISDYAVLDVHNEFANNKDYTVYKYILVNGDICETSSDTFHGRIVNYYEELVERGEFNSVEVKLGRQQSKYDTKMLVALLA